MINIYEDLAAFIEDAKLTAAISEYGEKIQLSSHEQSMFKTPAMDDLVSTVSDYLELVFASDNDYQPKTVAETYIQQRLIQCWLDAQPKQYILYWLSGTYDIIEGSSIEDAFTKAGFGAGAKSALDFYDVGNIVKYTWNNAKMDWDKIQ